ncbi:hypothetical protein DO73_4200 [Burkholderia pseudomallei]|nr:hypothetical protein DO73_4200 [Burkholderia pseudomallei]
MWKGFGRLPKPSEKLYVTYSERSEGLRRRYRGLAVGGHFAASDVAEVPRTSRARAISWPTLRPVMP